jgi:D-arabinose 5-phosphate isomerase GutQ
MLMVIDFNKNSLKLHEWLYDIVTNICYDRDYAYKAFCEAFNQLSTMMFTNGGTKEKGKIIVYGIKSEYNAKITYCFVHRLNYVGLNEVTVKCEIIDKTKNVIIEEHIKCFELSLGENIL